MRQSEGMALFMAEELLLLAYRPRGTPSVNLEMLDYTLSAAVLAELVILNSVTLENGHLRVRVPEPTGDTELDETLQRLARTPGRHRPSATGGSPCTHPNAAPACWPGSYSEAS